MEEKNTHGGARPGAGRKKVDSEARNSTLAIAGTASEITEIKRLASEKGMTVSRFIIESVLNKA